MRWRAASLCVLLALQVPMLFCALRSHFAKCECVESPCFQKLDFARARVAALLLQMAAQRGLLSIFAAHPTCFLTRVMYCTGRGA